MSKKMYRDNVIIKRRMLVAISILCLLFFVLIGRLCYIMIVQSSELQKKAVAQWTSEVKIDAKRGRILDRNYHELAVSANVYRIDLDMNTLKQTLDTKKITKNQLAPELASALNMKEDDVLKILNKKLPSGLPIGSATLKRRVEKDEADKVKNLKLRGIIVSPDTKRYYPNNNFLAQVIGHTNSDGVGLTGVELYYNSILSGKPGVRITETDNKSKELPYTISDYTKPQEGKDVVLTIDDMIQHFAEKAADQAIKDNNAKGCTITVMDPNNGEILAMVNKPDYNPNNPWQKGKTFDELQKEWRNKIVSDTFEPGSIFKIVTATAAMEEKVVKEDDKFTCNGSLKVANRVIHCWKRSGHGTENFVQILENSCNVGFMTLGQRIGKDKLYKYIQKFGFGQKTGIDLTGEAKGIIKKPQNMSDTDLATISFGQTNTVSSIQYITAFNAIANGGKWVQPHIMKQIIHTDDYNNRVVDSQYKTSEENIIDKSVAVTLRGYLEKVISEGGGQKAFIPGYHIAGKTGTAQKVNPKTGKYDPGKYTASFAGMAPANNPKITMLISIDEPNGDQYYAGQIATPVAKQLFYDIFNYLALKVDSTGEDAKSIARDVVIPEVRGLKKQEAVKILKENNIDCQIDSNEEYISDVNPKPGYTVKEGSKIILYTSSTSNYNKVVVVPDMKGYSKERAVNLLNSLGIKVKFNGEGIVSEQDIEAGKEVNKGTTITLLLDSDIGD